MSRATLSDGTKFTIQVGVNARPGTLGIRFKETRTNGVSHMGNLAVRNARISLGGVVVKGKPTTSTYHHRHVPEFSYEFREITPDFLELRLVRNGKRDVIQLPRVANSTAKRTSTFQPFGGYFGFNGNAQAGFVTAADLVYDDQYMDSYYALFAVMNPGSTDQANFATPGELDSVAGITCNPTYYIGDNLDGIGSDDRDVGGYVIGRQDDSDDSVDCTYRTYLQINGDGTISVDLAGHCTTWSNGQDQWLNRVASDLPIEPLPFNMQRPQSETGPVDGGAYAILTFPGDYANLVTMSSWNRSGISGFYDMNGRNIAYIVLPDGVSGSVSNNIYALLVNVPYNSGGSCRFNVGGSNFSPVDNFLTYGN